MAGRGTIQILPKSTAVNCSVADWGDGVSASCAMRPIVR